jgi:hypothetical protein
MNKKDKNIVLSDRDRDSLLDALETPPEPNEKLKEAAKRHKEMVIEMKKYFLTWLDGKSKTIEAPSKEAAIVMAKKGPAYTVDIIE